MTADHHDPHPWADPAGHHDPGPPTATIRPRRLFRQHLRPGCQIPEHADALRRLERALSEADNLAERVSQLERDIRYWKHAAGAR